MQSHHSASAAQTAITHIDYADTGFFSGIVKDYLAAAPQLKQFYQYPVNKEGIQQAINDRQDFPYNRATLVQALKEQYKNVQAGDKVVNNINLLLQKNTFTVTTAHQPNIFTGPLYFIYKILHAIKLAEELHSDFAGYNFVPVYYMGSEDADLDELGHFTVDGKKYQWKTKQTGAVGRMKVDKAFLALINELEAQVSVLPYGNELISLFRQSYKENVILQQCTLELVNTLFGEYGLVVLIPDNAALKRSFQPVVEKELDEQFSHTAVELTTADLSKYYKVQAGGRELNLFYLRDDKRERIELENDTFRVKALGLELDRQAIQTELEQHPERFSANVILRGVFQEMILPDIAFIGGGGEIAYWLELKKVFEQAGVPYPMLVLRNSFLVIPSKLANQWNELGFGLNDIFLSNNELLNRLTKRESANQLSLSEEKGELNSFYQQLHEVVSKTDASLAEHVSALQVQALKKIEALEKKILRSEKRKFEAEKKRIEKIRSILFPNGSLQERVENISGFYGREGKSFINHLYTHSLALDQQFTVIVL